MYDLKKKFKNNLKREVIEDFSKKQSYEPCDKELKEKIEEFYESYKESRKEKIEI